MKEHICCTNQFNGKIGVKSRVALSHLTEAWRVVTKSTLCREFDDYKIEISGSLKVKNA